MKTQNDNDLPLKTPSTMQNRNISATTGMIFSNLKLRLRGASQMFWKLKIIPHGRRPQN
jgi:hypothetical protein